MATSSTEGNKPGKPGPNRDAKGRTRRAKGSKETICGGDLFYMPAGHTLVVGHDSEIILFSPQAEHCAVIDHFKHRLSA